MAIRIETPQQALELLERAVATRGEDYVYPQRTTVLSDGTEHKVCDYVRDGQPSCLIGVVLHMAGWTLEELTVCETKSPEAFLIEGELARRFGTRFGDGVPGVLFVAQAAQDAGQTWGQALRAARDRAVPL